MSIKIEFEARYDEPTETYTVYVDGDVFFRMLFIR